MASPGWGGRSADSSGQHRVSMTTPVPCPKAMRMLEASPAAHSCGATVCTALIALMYIRSELLQSLNPPYPPCTRTTSSPIPNPGPGFKLQSDPISLIQRSSEFHRPAENLRPSECTGKRHVQSEVFVSSEKRLGESNSVCSNTKIDGCGKRGSIHGTQCRRS